MSEVRKWLEAIDLAQYADAFEANDLDIDLLGQVDDHDAERYWRIERRPPPAHSQRNRKAGYAG